ncbi:MAG: ParA family partition ATPase [Pseudomonadota bacterium]
MSASVIAVAQQKGGAGKTTVTAQLAAAWVERRLRVACIDTDPQGTLGAWAALRARTIRPPVEVRSVQGWRLGIALRELRASHDVVLVDSPPHAESEARVVVRESDLVVIPCQPSLLDVWAIGATLDLVKAEKRPMAVVWNRTPPRGRALDEARAGLADAGAVPLEMGFGNRTAFAGSMHQGLGAVESEPRSRAADEAREVATRLLTIARGRSFGLAR